MNKRINFEDTIFVLMIQIRMIKDLLRVDADPELFLEKSLEDIRFVDKALEILMKYLGENHKLIERDDLIKEFSDLEWHYSQVLGDFLSGKGGLSIREFPAVEENVRVLRSRSDERIKRLEDMGVTAGPQREEPLVSTDELNELLRDF